MTHQHVFDVRDYGATGDGETDDTTAIQAALDAAGVQGGTVYIPATTNGHIISSALVISGAAITVMGDGGLAGSKPLTNDSPCSAVVQVTDGTSGFVLGADSEYTKFQGLAVKGPRDSSAGAAIYVQDDPDSEIILIDVLTDGFRHGLRSGAASYHTKAFGCHFMWADHSSVYLTAEGTSHDFFACKMDRSPIGLYIGGHLSVGVYGGEIEGNTEYGVVIDGDHAFSNGAAMTFQGVYFEQVGEAVEADILIGDTEPVYAVNITGCLFIDHGGWNIDVKEGHHVTVMGCDLWADDAIRVQGASSSVVLINNHNRNSGTISGTVTTIPS